MKSLFWKQYQESKTHFIIFSTWMVLAALYSIGYELGHQYQAVVGGFSSSAMLYSVVAALALATRTAQGEQTEGTLGFTSSLPVSLRRVAAVRIWAAMLTLAIPILIAALVIAVSLAVDLIDQVEPRTPDNYVQKQFRPMATLSTSLEQLASVTAIAIWSGTWLLLIVSVCGCWLRSQAQVGLIGVVIALGSLIASGLMWTGEPRPNVQLLYGALIPQSLVIHWGYGTATGQYVDHELAQYRWGALGLAIPWLLLWGSLFVVCYGKPMNRAPKSIRFHFSAVSPLSLIPIHLRRQWTALVWIELRQSLPLAVCGLLLAILVAIATQLMEQGAGVKFADSVQRELPHSMFFVGMLWSVVVASSLYSTDLDSKLGSFRRTRPISSTQWFWNKFVIGLAAVLVVMDGATIFASWNTTPISRLNDGMSYAYIACFPIIHALMYALGVLGTCLFRRPLKGGIFAIVCYTVATVAVTTLPGTMHLEPIAIYNNLLAAERADTVDLMKHNYPLVYGFLGLMVIVCAQSASNLAKPYTVNFQWMARAL
jgi:hypothetical protein